MLKRMFRKTFVRYTCLMCGTGWYFNAKYKAFIIFMPNIDCHSRFSMIFKNLTCTCVCVPVWSLDTDC